MFSSSGIFRISKLVPNSILERWGYKIFNFKAISKYSGICLQAPAAPGQHYKPESSKIPVLSQKNRVFRRKGF